MALPHSVLRVWLQLGCLPALAAAAAAGDPAEDETTLLQVDLKKLAGDERAPPQQPGSRVDLVLDDLAAVGTSGVLTRGLAPTATCGRSTPQDRTESLALWRSRHPHEDGFCYFQNVAWWFQGYGQVSDYRAATRNGADIVSNSLCPRTKAIGGAWPRGTGPTVTVSYDAGLVRIAHLDTCLDAVDDLYCYSLGWLKGQRLDGGLMDNRTAWEALAKAECERIRRAFPSVENETLDSHMSGTVKEFAASVCAFNGRCPPVTRRLHHEHVYTKCLLGLHHASTEMGYCYHKGCVTPDGSIEHADACGY